MTARRVHRAGGFPIRIAPTFAASLALLLVPSAAADWQVEQSVELGGDHVDLYAFPDGSEDPNSFPVEAQVWIAPFFADLNGGPYGEPCMGLYQNMLTYEYRRFGGACAGAHLGCPVFLVLPIGDGFCLNDGIVWDFP